MVANTGNSNSSFANSSVLTVVARPETDSHNHVTKVSCDHENALFTPSDAGKVFSVRNYGDTQYPLAEGREKVFPVRNCGDTQYPKPDVKTQRESKVREWLHSVESASTAFFTAEDDNTCRPSASSAASHLASESSVSTPWTSVSWEQADSMAVNFSEASLSLPRNISHVRLIRKAMKHMDCKENSGIRKKSKSLSTQTDSSRVTEKVQSKLDPFERNQNICVRNSPRQFAKSEREMQEAKKAKEPGFLDRMERLERDKAWMDAIITFLVRA